MKGFTLLEMLLAIAVISIVGTTISTAIGGVANQTYSLERRTVAHWIGQNTITRLRLDLRSNPRVLAEGRVTNRSFMGDREWLAQTEIKGSEHPLLRRVEVDVYELVDGDRRGPYDHLTAFVGRH